MRKSRLFGILSIFSVMLGANLPANAATISFDFEATVTVVDPALTTSVGLVGQTGSGSITYDMNPVVEVPGWYGFEVPPAEYSFSISSISLLTGTIPNTPTSPALTDMSVDVRNDTVTNVGQPPSDTLIYWGNNIDQTIDGHQVRMALVLNDSSSSVFNDVSLPTQVPNLSDFDSAVFQIQREFSAVPGAWTAGITLQIDSITASTVPIPPAIWLFGSGLLGLVGLARRKKAD